MFLVSSTLKFVVQLTIERLAKCDENSCVKRNLNFAAAATILTNVSHVHRSAELSYPRRFTDIYIDLE